MRARTKAALTGVAATLISSLFGPPSISTNDIERPSIIRPRTAEASQLYTYRLRIDCVVRRGLTPFMRIDPIYLSINAYDHMDAFSRIYQDPSIVISIISSRLPPHIRARRDFNVHCRVVAVIDVRRPSIIYPVPGNGTIPLPTPPLDTRYPYGQILQSAADVKGIVSDYISSSGLPFLRNTADIWRIPGYVRDVHLDEFGRRVSTPLEAVVHNWDGNIAAFSVSPQGTETAFRNINCSAFQTYVSSRLGKNVAYKALTYPTDSQAIVTSLDVGLRGFSDCGTIMPAPPFPYPTPTQPQYP